MDDHYIMLGFGTRGIYGAQRIRVILGHSMQAHGQVDATQPEAAGFVVTYTGDNGKCIGPHTHGAIRAGYESTLILVMLVDQADPVAIEAATQVGHQAKTAGVYLSVAVCVTGTPCGAGEFMTSSAMQTLRSSVDAVVCIQPGTDWVHEDMPGTRIALALMSAVLPSIVNTICTDVADMKQILQGVVIAQLTAVSQGSIQSDTACKYLGAHFGANGGRYGAPQAFFSAYSASPEAFQITDMEIALGGVRDDLETFYPTSDLPFLIAGLMDPSLVETAEILTCVTFE